MEYLNRPVNEGGDWCEIEPGVWYYFEPMPLTDDEVIQHHSDLSSEVARLATLERDLQTEVDRMSDKLQKYTGDWHEKHTEKSVNALGQVQHRVGDGRDVLSVAPKTRQSLNELRQQLAEVQRAFDKALNEKLNLVSQYPATLLPPST